MESKDILLELKKSINQLKKINKTPLNLSKDKNPEQEEKDSILTKKLVPYFHGILSDNFNKKEQNSPESKENKNNYWIFISKHFNTPLVRFCKEFEKNELNNSFKGDNSVTKGKNWIYLSILDNTFYDSINEIYKHKWDYKNSILRKKKSDIYLILNELNQIQFNNINNKDYKKYLEYLEKNNYINNQNYKDIHFNSKSLGSPIIGIETYSNQTFSDISEISIINNNPIDNNTTITDPINSKLLLKEKEEFTVTKNADFAPKIINNFYTFNHKIVKNKNIENIIIDEEESFEINNIKSNNYLKLDIDNNNDDVFNSNSSNLSEENNKPFKELILNPKTTKFLPTDNLYEINEISLSKNYSKNDNLRYNKKIRPMTNCFLLYLNKYYKKVLYHKFYKHNLNHKPISLKEQNYQCYICYKNFSFIFKIPLQPIFWCSYYMRYICKDCIDDEYSIIPYFVLEKWCFDKFPISKKAKNIILNWYNKPVIYFKKNDKLLKKIPQLNKVIKIKKIINDIFNIMKCENKFKYVEDILGEYEYLALKEYLFSMRDLVEINNKTFYNKIKEFKNIFAKHISGECPKCKYEGEICNICGFDEKIFFYDIENVFYSRVNRKSYHKKCIEIGHIH